jgi:hypothetical protein
MQIHSAGYLPRNYLNLVLVALSHSALTIYMFFDLTVLPDSMQAFHDTDCKHINFTEYEPSLEVCREDTRCPNLSLRSVHAPSMAI